MPYFPAALVVGAPLAVRARQAADSTKAPAADSGGIEEVVDTAN